MMGSSGRVRGGSVSGAGGDMPAGHRPPGAGSPERRSARARWRGVGALCLTVCIALPPSLAHAQQPAAPAPAEPSSVERADALFNEGRELFDQGRFREACEKFDQSLALDPSPGTLLNLGNCYEPQGDLVRALATFERAFADAQKSNNPERRELWSNAARERISSLTGRLPQISVRGAGPGTSVSLDDKPIDATSGFMRINPGRHVIAAMAPGKRAFRQEFDIAQGQRFAINIPPLEAEAGSAQPAAASAPTEAPPPEPASAGQSKYGIWPYVIGGAGVAMLGTSLITGLSAKSKADDLEQACGDDHVCEPKYESTKNSAESLALATDILWITGAIAAGVGVTLFILDDGATESGTAVQTGCFDAGCGILASGRF